MRTWNDLYKNDEFKNARTPPAECVMEWAGRSFNLSSGPVLLDLGCGTGRNAFALIDKGAVVHGCDYAPSIIEHLRSSHSKLASLEVCEADALPYPDNSFDGVFCHGVLFYIPPERIRTSLKEMFRVVRPLGAVFVSTACVDDKRSAVGFKKFGETLTYLTGAELVGMAESAGFMVAWLMRSFLVPKAGIRQQDWLLSAMKPAN